MSTNKTAKVQPKSAKKAATAPMVRRKAAELTPKEEEQLIDKATRLIIGLNKDALKELERY